MIITRLSNFLVLSPKIAILSVVNHSRKKFVERFSYSFHRRATSLINSTGSPFSDSLKSRVHGRNPFSLSIHKGQSLSPLGCHFSVHVFPFIRVTWTRHLYGQPTVSRGQVNSTGCRKKRSWQKLGICPSQRPPRNNAMGEIDFRIWVERYGVDSFDRRLIINLYMCFLPT